MGESKRPIISLIIPFYNVERYIGQCLESVYNQDIPEEDYEVICVNDASPDNSREIVLEYQKKHKNLILVEHEINKKLGSARNTGRAIATGKYIWNIDSDDKIHPMILSTILDYCERFDLDILIFNFYHLYSNNQISNKAYPFIDSSVENGISFIKKYCIGNFAEISPIWTQIYKKDFLEVNDIFSPPINMGEDVPFSLKSLLLAHRIKSIVETCYVYRVNEFSLTGSNKISPSAEKVYENCFVCSRYVNDVIKFIPRNELSILDSYSEVVKHILLLLPSNMNTMEVEEAHKLKKLLRNNIFNNIWMFRYVNVKYLFFYFKLITQ